MKLALAFICLMAELFPAVVFSQDTTNAVDKIANFPNRLFARVHKKAADLNTSLDKQTEKYLRRLAKKEEKLKKEISKLDSNAAKNLFANSGTDYKRFIVKLTSDTSTTTAGMQGEYLSNADSLQGSVSFLNQNKQLLASSPGSLQKLQNSVAELKKLQSKLGDADQVKAYIRERKEQLKQYLALSVACCSE